MQRVIATTSIHGARCALGPQETAYASVTISGGRILSLAAPMHDELSCNADIDLNGFLLMPGFVNAHDHLEFSLFPRLGNPPYRSYIDWGEDIHRRFPDVIRKHRSVPKDLRLWWGGIRNLLCGVATVSHHNPLYPELVGDDFPVRVVRKYGWGHSLALGGDLREARAATPQGHPFIVHACEGVDEQARQELRGLEQLGLLDEFTVLVHGLAIDQEGTALMRDRQASLILCPSSNSFLFGAVPDLSVLGEIQKIALGNDSPLTAEGDLLNEIQFALRSLRISPLTAYEMVTTIAAAILRLDDAEGSIKENGTADLIAIRDTGQNPAEMLESLSINDVEFVMVAGRVHLASETIVARLPFEAQHGLEPLSVDGSIRWLRAPVKTLLQRTEEVLGEGAVQLGKKKVCFAADLVNAHAR